MYTVWIKILLVADMVLMFGRVRSEVHSSRACHFSTNHCGSHSLECSSNEKVAIVDAYHTDNTECKTTECNNIHESTNRNILSNSQLTLVDNKCTSQRHCKTRAQQGPPPSHQTFSVIKYQCINDDSEIQECQGDTKTGCDISLLLSQPTNCTCSIRRKLPVAIGMIDFHLLEMSLPNRTCTKLHIHVGGKMQSYDCTTPLKPYRLLASGIHQTNDDTWITIQTGDNKRTTWIQIKGSESFTVTCNPLSAGREAGLSTFNDSETCPGYITTPSPGQGTTNGVVKSTHADTSEQGNTGAVAGGVTVAVLVIIAVVLVFLWFRHKRNQNSKTKSSIEKSPSENYSGATRITDHNYHEIEAMQPKELVRRNYDYATVAGKVNHPGQKGQSPLEEDYDHIGNKLPNKTVHHDTTLPTAKSYNNKSFTESEDDYNHLAADDKTTTVENGVHSGGYDTTVSASKSVQHIRNKGVSNDDSECDYNHIDNNPKPKLLQGDYDTTASASKAVAKMMETDEKTEDDYDHCRQTKAGNQAADSPYDTAEHHAEHSGDYSIAGVLQKNDPYDLAK